MSEEVDAYLRDLETSWPPEHVEEIAGCRLRSAPGGGRRVNSAMLSASGDLDAALAATERFYAARQLPPTLQLSLKDLFTPHPHASELRARSYAHDVSALLYDAPIDAAVASGPQKPKAAILEVRTPLAVLDRLWARGDVTEARRNIMRRADPRTATIFLARRRDEIMGAAFASLGGERVFAHALYVVPEHRRKGAAAELLAACARYGQLKGARALSAAVVADNQASQALMEGFGGAAIGAYQYYVKTPVN